MWYNHHDKSKSQMTEYPDKAMQYDACKKKLAAQFADDRRSYTAGKQELIGRLLKEAHTWKSGT